MLRFFAPFLLVASVAWAIVTWWRARRARSAEERAFIERTHAAMGVFTGLAVMSLAFLDGRSKLMALPLFLAVGLGLRHSIRKGRRRFQEAAMDPLRRAKRVN